MSTKPLFKLFNRKAIKNPRRERDEAAEQRENLKLFTKALTSKRFSEGKEILVPFCKEGNLCKLLAEREAKLVVGCEPRASYFAAQRGIRREQGDLPILFLEEDPCALPYPDAAFDVILLDRVIEYCADSTELLAECERLLREGGLLLLASDMKYGPHGCGTPMISMPWANRFFSEKTRATWIKERCQAEKEGEKKRASLLYTDTNGRVRLRTEPRLSRKTLLAEMKKVDSLQLRKTIAIPAEKTPSLLSKLPLGRACFASRLLLIYEKAKTPKEV